jgi:tRNA modification GTPase
MKNFNLNDTICAISTPPGEAGIGIVRLSGKNALEIADEIFMPRNGKRPSQMNGYTVHYGHIVKIQNPKSKIQNKSEIIDEVLLTVMKAPKSYTKENVVEISAHGGITCLRKILELVLSQGARLAEPGEFTKRAFLNGRIDLSQAEAVLDMITARTEASLKAAQAQLKGELSKSIKNVKDRLLEIQANVEASLDFPDEELKTLDNGAVEKSICDIISKLNVLLGEYQYGRILREGITTVICGKPNVGKSTLMNRLLKQERVIVTPVPGTTRDAIEEITNVRGIPLKVVDTAGVINAADEPTKEGVRRSREYMQSADLILLVLDSSGELAKEDIDIIGAIKDKKILVVVNKKDLKSRLDIDEVKRRLHNKKIIKISAKKDKNLGTLHDAICDMIWSGSVASSRQPLLTNARHAVCIEKALRYLESAKKTIKNNSSVELLAVDLKDALYELNLILGEGLQDELLDAIFSRFCIGK